MKTLPEIEAKIPSDKYFDIVEKLRAYLHSDDSQLKDFKELSFEAWRYSEQVNQEQAAAKKVEAQRENIIFLTDFSAPEPCTGMSSILQG